MVIFNAVLIVAIVLCVLLVLIILTQNPKGGGLSSAIGGGSGSQMFGVQQTNNFLTNATWGLAIGVAVIVLFSGFLLPTSSSSNGIEIETEEPIIEDFDLSDEETTDLPARPSEEPSVEENLPETSSEPTTPSLFDE